MKKQARRARGTGGLRRGRNNIYIARYTGADGAAIKRSTGTTDRKDAEAILTGWIQREARVRQGLEAPEAVRTRDEASRPLREHLDEYLEAFTRAESRTPATMRVRRSIFNTFVRLATLILHRAPKLKDLTPDLLERVMHHRVNVERRSARTANTQRQYLCAFASWATEDGRADLTTLARRVKPRKEDLDRRRERRALTDAEAGRLCEGPRGLFYRLALEAGLRRNELKHLTWPDIDIEAGLITVRSTKTRKADQVPLATSDLLEALKAARPLLAPGARPRVFLTVPTHRTVRKDLERAGIALRDDDGRVADLHALRKTLGSRLARAGVVPQVATRIMRHSDYRTTVRHYHHLTINDQRAGLEKALARSTPLLAEGTSGGVFIGVSTRAGGGTSSGTSRGTLRGSRPSESVREGAGSTENGGAIETPQALSLRDFVRALAERCESVLESAPSRTVGAVGQQPIAQAPAAHEVAHGDSRAVHRTVHQSDGEGLRGILRALVRLDDAALEALLD